MRLRVELFVTDLRTSVSFYTQVLGFTVARDGDDYVSLQRGRVVLGLGPVDKLPAQGDGGGFTVARLRADRGAGVEIVLELDDLDQVTALYEHCRHHTTVAQDLQERPWGLYDFRLLDPDGYYLRITHGDAAANG